jgi:hypothetical protein
MCTLGLVKPARCCCPAHCTCPFVIMPHSGAAYPTPAAPEVIPQLPDTAVACVLQHVPLQQLLTSCALVCRAWAAAAATFTTEIDVLFKRSNHCVQLQDWLAQHGCVLVALTAQHSPCAQSISTHPWRLPVLQLMQLHSLNLSRVKAQLSAQGASTCSSTRCSLGSSGGLTHTGASSSSSAGRAAAAAIGLPQLQELALCDCDLNLQLMSQLLSATTPTKLRWDGMQPALLAASKPQRYPAACCTCIQHAGEADGASRVAPERTGVPVPLSRARGAGAADSTATPHPVAASGPVQMPVVQCSASATGGGLPVLLSPDSIHPTHSSKNLRVGPGELRLGWRARAPSSLQSHVPCRACAATPQTLDTPRGYRVQAALCGVSTALQGSCQLPSTAECLAFLGDSCGLWV